MELLDNVQYKREINFKLNEVEKSNKNRITNKEKNEPYKNKSQYIEIEELPLPNINNLRKWINKDKKAG